MLFGSSRGHSGWTKLGFTASVPLKSSSYGTYQSSSKLEKDCFQIAFVIFVVGHVLAPATKHVYATIDFWGELSNTETISQFNWCEYVLDCLMEAVRRVKNDMIANNPGTNLVGCHLFLQVFFLDNVDLGMFNKKHDVLPRISDFDQDSLRRMITMSTDIGKGATSHSNCKLRSAQDVCYARSKYPEHPPNNMNPQTTSGDPSASIARDPDHQNVKEHSRAAFPDQVLDVQTPLRVLGPLDFTQYLRAHYPSLINSSVHFQRGVYVAQPEVLLIVQQEPYRTHQVQL